VNGHAVGGGWGLALACDFRIAAAEAQFWIPEVDLGVPLGVGTTTRFVRMVGPARAKEIIMGCARYSAADAQTWGLVNRVVPGAALAQAARDYAELLAKKPVRPLAEVKARINAIARTGIPEVNAMTEGFLDRDEPVVDVLAPRLLEEKADRGPHQHEQRADREGAAVGRDRIGAGPLGHGARPARVEHRADRALGQGGADEATQVGHRHRAARERGRVDLGSQRPGEHEGAAHHAQEQEEEADPGQRQVRSAGSQPHGLAGDEQVWELAAVQHAVGEIAGEGRRDEQRHRGQ
jgi:hypothetical protein